MWEDPVKLISALTCVRRANRTDWHPVTRTKEHTNDVRIGPVRTLSPDRSPQGRPSLGHLLSQLSEQTARLVRAEIDLAKAELIQKAKAAGVGIGLLAGAAFLGFFAFAVLITVVILALSEAFAPWLAALIVLAVLFVAIGILAALGIKKLKQGVPPTPGKAIDGVKQDAEAVTTALKEGLQR